LLRYYINVLSKVTRARTFNFLKLLAGYYYSRATKKSYQFGMPVFVSMEPTTSCNLRCPQCPSGLREFTRETGKLEREFFEKTIPQLSKHLHSLTFYFQGEPYLNRDFLGMVRIAADLNVFTITSTNAHYLDTETAKKTVESGLDKLIISIDGTTQESYAAYRVGGQLHKVIEGTKAVLEQKRLLKSSTPHVVWQFVVFAHNEHQVKEVKKLGRQLGVNEIKIKTAQIYDFEGGNEFIPSDIKYSRYNKSDDGKYKIRNRLLNHCWRMWQGCVITWDGKVVPCCFDKDASHRLGNLNTQTFKDVWLSEPYTKFRQTILGSRKSVDICTNCTEGTKVWS
jgi:radical SAM protein with 4Fe4S-binding SPASM domain